MLLIVLAAVLIPGVWSEIRTIPQECNPRLYTHYDEMGCTPVFGTGPCPIKYDCPQLQSRSKQKCYVGGVAYEPDASIGTFSRACSAGCFCQLRGNSAKIVCAQIECPEFFNPNFRQPGCILQYSIDKCCSDDKFCPNATKNVTDITCQYQGKVYLKGQKFYPTEESCKVCVCQEGFTGALTEPWCKKINCGIELHHDDDIQDGCIPKYFGGCCPIEYRCPQVGDQVRQVSTEGSPDARTSADKCVYGSLEMNIGDTLDMGADNCTECSCTTPPFAICQHKCNNK